MAVIYDARGNEFAGHLDTIGNVLYTDARTATATVSALNAEVDLDLNGHGTAVFDCRTAAGAMTLSFQATVDGTNYFAIPVITQATNAVVTTVAITTTLASTFVANVAGYRRCRVIVTAFTSGTCVVAARASAAPPAMIAPMPYPASSAATTLSTANTTVTLTLAAPGAGLFHYLTGLEIIMVNGTAVAVAGTALLGFTTTNLPGTMAWSVGNAMAVGGTQTVIAHDFSYPVKSTTANTATTIVAPAAGAGVQVRITAFYFIAA